MHGLRSSLRRSVVVVSSGASLALVAACGDPAPDADLPGGIAGFTEMAVPAVEGSGEPHLSSGEDGVWLSWLEPAGDTWALRVARVEEGGIGSVSTITERSDFFVNWADFPSVVPLDDGRLAAHWLQRGDAGGYDYGVRVAWSDDGGLSWSEPWTPHADATPTEHGFVSLLPMASGDLGVLWLDGRRYVDGPEGPATEEMTLRFRRRAGPDADASAEVVIDGRVCDCCQTGAARTTDGWVVVYRERSDDELRDIFAARLVDDVWTEGRPVHRDGWHIEACPVNGPAVDADGSRVAVAWFTGAGDVPRVSLAFSDDQGDRFSEPIRIDDGDPVGRVDVVMDGDGALVSWIERVGDGAELRLRRVVADGSMQDPVVVARVAAARAAGFPRMVRDGDDLVVAWTDATEASTRLRVGRIPGGVR